MKKCWKISREHRWTKRRTEGPNLPVATDVCWESLNYFTFDHMSYLVSSKPHFAWSFIQYLKHFSPSTFSQHNGSKCHRYQTWWNPVAAERCFVWLWSIFIHFSFSIKRTPEHWLIRVIKRVVLVNTHCGADGHAKQSKTTCELSWQWPCSGSALFIVPDSRCCSVSRLLCSLIDWPPLLGLSN